MRIKMTKADLKTGMVVETRNGEKYLVMLNPDCMGRELINLRGGFVPLCDYVATLEYCRGTDFDIVKVYTAGMSIGSLFRLPNGEKLRLELIWERSAVKEMTVEEIEKELGYKIKIVGDNPELLKGCCNNEQKLDI